LRLARIAAAHAATQQRARAGRQHGVSRVSHGVQTTDHAWPHSLCGYALSWGRLRTMHGYTCSTLAMAMLYHGAEAVRGGVLSRHPVRPDSRRVQGIQGRCRSHYTAMWGARGRGSYPELNPIPTLPLTRPPASGSSHAPRLCTTGGMASCGS